MLKLAKQWLNEPWAGAARKAKVGGRWTGEHWSSRMAFRT